MECPDFSNLKLSGGCGESGVYVSPSYTFKDGKCFKSEEWNG